MRKQYSPTFKAQVVLELLKEEKTIGQISSEHHVHPTQLRRWKEQAMEGLVSVFADDRKEQHAKEAEHEQKLEELYAEIGRLSTQLSWLKKNVAETMSRSERMAMIEHGAVELPVTIQAELLGINRTSLYYKPGPPSAEELLIKRRIDEIYTEHPFYGSRRITAVLKEELGLCRKTVQHHMREMGIAGICPGPNLSKRRLDHKIYPYLLRNVKAACPNHVWGRDITYIRLANGWMYMVVVLDWHSRYVVSWELDQSLEMPFVLSAVDCALAQAAPQIWNTDQGSHFTSPQYIERLTDAQVKISMDGKGRALDNIFTERFWRTVKYEEVYLNEYTCPREARQQLARYVAFYNHERPHQSLDYRTPAEVYFGKEVIAN